MAKVSLPPSSVYAVSDMRLSEITYPGYNGDPITAYVARPFEEGNYPGVVIVHGVHGYEEHMRDMARRYTLFGYTAIIPALFSREGDILYTEDDDPVGRKKCGDWTRNRTDAQTIGDLEGARKWLEAQDYVRSDRIGVVGFCSGGRAALVYACGTTGLRCFVNGYSNGIMSPTEANPIPTIDKVKDLCCPMLGLFGADDTNPSPADVERLGQELTRHNKNFEIVSYKGASHAFFSDTRESYRPEVCQMAWGRMIEWLARYLKDDAGSVVPGG